MQQPRRDLLARACRTADQHPAAGPGHALQRRAHLIDAGGIAGEAFRLAQILAATGAFTLQPLGLGGAGDQQQQPLGLERLFDEVHRAAADGGHRRVDIAMAGENNDRQGRFARLDRVEHFEPVHRAAVQPDVEQHQARPPLVDGGQRAGAVAGGAALIALVLEHPGHEFANVLLVVHYQDVEGHQLISLQVVPRGMLIRQPRSVRVVRWGRGRSARWRPRRPLRLPLRQTAARRHVPRRSS